MLKEKKTLGGGLTPNLRTMPAPSGGEKKDLPKKKKDPIVSKAELDKSGFTNLRDFMNNYENKDGKFVKRAKALTRREDKRSDTTVSPAIQKQMYQAEDREEYKKGGSVKSKSKSASSRGDGIAQRGKTRA